MLKRNYQAIDKARWEHQFQDVLRGARQRAKYKLRNTFFDFIPISSSTELGLDQLWALISLQNPLQAGEVIEYDGLEWLVLYEDRRPEGAYRKLLLNRVSDYITVNGVSTPFAFQSSVKSATKIDTYLRGFFSADTVDYMAIGWLPKNHNTQQILRYFNFRYADSQWETNQVFKNVFEGVIGLSLKSVPLNEDLDIQEPILDKVKETNDYRIEIKGDRELLVDETITLEVLIYDKATNEKVDMPFVVQANNLNVEIVNDQMNHFSITGLELGKSTITIISENQEVEAIVEVEVISLW